MLPKLILVLGGAASGKSAWAENLLLTNSLNPVYLATSRVFDDEIKNKVQAHKSRRCDRWLNFEADSDLSPVLAARRAPQGVLIDCATMWLTNQFIDNKDILAAQSDLLAALDACPVPVVIVSNELGHGIVPADALSRRFREAQGRLNIALAEKSDATVLVVAGLPQVLKGQLP